MPSACDRRQEWLSEIENLKSSYSDSERERWQNPEPGFQVEMISSNVLKNSVKIEYALDALTNFKIKKDCDVPNDVYCQWITGAPFSRPALSVASVFVYHADTIK